MLRKINKLKTAMVINNHFSKKRFFGMLAQRNSDGIDDQK